MEKNFISVLMPVYNTEIDVVKRAVDSVLKQDYQNFEFIIIDDGSHNDPENKLLNYVKQFQDKITYIFHENRGQSKSINQAISITKGQFITFLDSDDEYKPNHLSACLQEMKDADLIASYTDTIVDSDDDYFVPDKKVPNKLVHVDDCVLFATLFGKKEIFEKIKFLNRYGADDVYFKEAAKNYKVKKVDLRTYIYYRNRTNSISSILKNKFLAKTKSIH